MTLFRALTIQSGITKQIGTSDSLAVGTGIDTDAAGTLTVGSSQATAITLTPATTASSTLTSTGLLTASNALTVTTGTTTIGAALTQSGGAVSLTATGASSFTSNAALTLTGGAASTWSTSAGTLNVSGFAGLNLQNDGSTYLDAGATTSGAITVASGINETAVGGASAFDWSAASGAFKTSSGAVSVNGNTTFTGSTTVTVDAFGTAGVVHNAAGGLLSSSLIVNADLSGGAAISVSKLAAGTSGQVLLNNATPTPTWTTLSGDVTVGATGTTTVNSISGTAPVNVANSALSFGTTVAASGNIRVPNNTTILVARNAANTADMPIISTDNVNDIQFASGSYSVEIGQNFSNPGAGIIVSPSSGNITFNVDGAQVLGILPGIIRSNTDNTVTLGGTTQNWSNVYAYNYTFPVAAASPTIKQLDLITSSGTGKTLTIQAQNETGTTSVGGALVLTSGTGTSTNGAVNIQAGGTNALTISGAGAVAIPSFSTGIVQSSSVGVLSSAALNLAGGSSYVTGNLPVTNIAHGSNAQVLLTNGSTPTWTTLSGDGYVSATGVLTVTQAAGNFTVLGNLQVNGTENVLGTSIFQNPVTFDGNLTVADGYTLTTDSILSAGSDVLTINGAGGINLQNAGTTYLEIGTAGSGIIYVPSGVTLEATGTGQIIATSSSGTTAITVPFNTSATTAGYAVYVSANDTVSTASSAAIATSYCAGFAEDSTASGHVFTDGLVTPVITGGTASAGQIMYLDQGGNAGQVTATVPTSGIVAPVGYMKNATQMIVRVLTPVKI